MPLLNSVYMYVYVLLFRKQLDTTSIDIASSNANSVCVHCYSFIVELGSQHEKVLVSDTCKCAPNVFWLLHDQYVSGSYS